MSFVEASARIGVATSGKLDGVRVSSSRVVRKANPSHPLNAFVGALKDPRVVALLDKSKSLKKMVTPGLIDYGAFDSEEHTKIKCELAQLLRESRSKIPASFTKLVDSRPVNRRVLYERLFEDAPVLDVGSGDGRRLVGSSLTKVVTLDPKYARTDIIADVEDHIQAEFCDQLPERTVVSFNAITQVGEEPMVGRNGIHVAPHVQSFVAAGMSTLVDGVYETVLDGVKYYDKPITVPVVELSSHSVGLNTYAEAEINLIITQESEVFPGRFKSLGFRRMPHLVEDPDWTPKLNGELCEIFMSGGVGRVRFRDSGQCFRVSSHVSTDLHIFCEYFRGNFFLLRIVRYAGFEPFHSLRQIEYFLSRVKIRVRHCGTTGAIRPPPRVSAAALIKGLEQGWFEGIVVRERQHDYLVRAHPSIDVRHSGLGVFVARLVELGFVVDCSVPVYDGVGEILLKFGEGGYSSGKVEFVFFKHRGEKGEDPVRVLDGLSAQPCLARYFG